jgi:hypothetical protein
MRSLALLPLLILAACSGGGEDPAAQNKAKAEAAKKLQLASGQWQVSTEVTRFDSQDNGTPAINTPVGTKHEASACVAEGEGKKPVPALLAGHEDYDCEYGSFYMSSGTLNAQLNCRREGLSGEIRMTVDGTYTADGIQAEQSISTFLSGTGDVTMQTRLTARHAAPACAPAGEAKAS